MKTTFEVIELPEPEGKWKYVIRQNKRNVYYEDTINSKKYRDINIAQTEDLATAQKLVAIFTEFPFTSEFLDKYRYLRDDEKIALRKNPGYRSVKEFKIYSISESKVRWEEDFYNGTDQSQTLFQLMKDKDGKYSAKSQNRIICRFWDNNYFPRVLNVWSLKSGKLFFEE